MRGRGGGTRLREKPLIIRGRGWQSVCFDGGMPSTSQSRSATEAPTAAKFPVLVLALTVMVGLIAGLGCIGGAVYLLIKTGKIHPGPLLASSDRGSDRGLGVQLPTHTFSLEPILVNLSDPGGHAYLRLGLAVVLEDAPGMSPPVASATAPAVMSLPREREIPIRDTVLAVLGEQTSSGLLAPGDKERLKEELQAALASHNPELKLRGLYFSDFLVQP
jgi:flagellar protein FliL